MAPQTIFRSALSACVRAEKTRRGPDLSSGNSGRICRGAVGCHPDARSRAGRAAQSDGTACRPSFRAGDLAGLIDTIRSAVPEYEPSSLVLAAMDAAERPIDEAQDRRGHFLPRRLLPFVLAASRARLPPGSRSEDHRAGAHLSPEFGCTAQEIEKDGLPIEARIECLLSSDSDVGMAKTIGLATLGLADCLGSMRPDLLLVTADRYEMLAPAAVATALRIPLATIEGGEISEGVIDDAVRNALTKLSHVHFTSTELARARVIAMGEEAWRVHRVGGRLARPPAPHSAARARIGSKRRLGVHLQAAPPPSSPTTPPPSPATPRARPMRSSPRSLPPPRSFLFLLSNADAGSRALIARTESFIRERGDGRVFVNLDPVLYWSLLRCVDLLVGNSSSRHHGGGVVRPAGGDVGIRQRGRERAATSSDAEASIASILDGIRTASSDEFRRSLQGMENPYGDGHAAERIASVWLRPAGRGTC